MAKNESEELIFSVDGQLISELGQRLVASDYIALAELVKNSYDADAKAILVSVYHAKQVSQGCRSKIIVEDDGVGMTFEEVKHYWMRVATAHKVHRYISTEYLRPRTGNKGVGRFSCQRIARKLILETVAKRPDGKYEKTKVFFDWKKYSPGTDLELIPNCYQRKTSSSKKKTGTTLKLVGLRDKWTERDFNALRRQLFSLYMVSSVKRTEIVDGKEKKVLDPGVKVEFNAPDFSKGEGILVEQFMDAGWGRLGGKVDSQGRLNLTLNAKEIGKVKYTYQSTFSKLKGVSFDVAYIPLNKEHFRDTSTATHHSYELIKEQSGIRAYFEEFRVFPYGEPDDDWLGIEHDVARRLAAVDDEYLREFAKGLSVDPKRVLLLHPRNRNLIGKISTYKSPHFDIKMDREGFMENEGLQDLRAAIRVSLNWMTIMYGVYQQILKKNKYEQVQKDFSNSIGKLDQPSETITSSALKLLTSSARMGTAKETKRPTEAIRKAGELLKTKIEDTESELTILRMVASSAPMMFIFAHEVRGVINELETHATLIQRNLPAIADKKLSDELQLLAKDFTQSSKRLTDITKMFDIFSAPRDSKKNKFVLLKACKRVVDSFGFIANEFHIDVNTDSIGSRIKVGLILEAELYSVIVNLFSNAVKASIVSKHREIRFEANNTNGQIELKVLDKGVGLSKDNWEKVFSPMIRDPEDRIYKSLSAKIGDEQITTLGQGSGLGLGIVRSILKSNGSTISFVDPPKGWSTCVLVKFNG